MKKFRKMRKSWHCNGERRIWQKSKTCLSRFAWVLGVVVQILGVKIDILRGEGG